jgi:Dolichyl-phosphate-mannose-protein mannosyltransferase
MNSERNWQPRTVTAGVILLLGMMAALAGGAARRESITVDEVAHVGAGVSYLQKLDLRLNVEHPPLVKALAALPLVLTGVRADYTDLSWSFSDGFFKQYLGQWAFGHRLVTRWNNPYSTLLLARAPMLLLTLVLGWLLYFYGARLGSPAGGVLCLAAYATMPAFLAFGPLVLTDTAVALFSLLTLWSFADMWRSPTRGAIFQFGLALAAALLSKFSAGLLFFCFPAFVLSLRLRPLPGQPTDKRELRTWRRLRWRSLIAGTGFAALVVYLVYLVLSWNQATDSFSIIPHFPASSIARRLLMPPWIYLQGLVMFAFTASRATYILGHAYAHGVWFYFPVLFFLKSPLAFLGLLLLALVVALVAKFGLNQSSAIAEGMELHWRALWVFVVVLAGACILGRLDISIRHFSIPLALLILLLAPLPRLLERFGRSGWPAARVGYWLTAALALTSVFVAVRAYPYYLPFLNSLSLGRPGYELVNDSNLDWNQALPDVEQWVASRSLTRVLVDEYSFSDPVVYVPQAEFWDCQQPSASDGGEWAVVSASMIADGHNCPWLLAYPHQSLAGGSMYAFELPRVIPAAGAPGGPPLPADWHNWGGMQLPLDIRRVILDCIRDPGQLQPTYDGMQAMSKAAAAKAKK